MAKELNGVEKELQMESFHLRHEFERISSELDFAGQLAELHPGMAGKWRGLISKAAALIEGRSAGCGPEAFAKLVREAEKILAPIGESAKKYVIHCVGHAHIDMNWMWSWPETVAITNDTFSTVLKLMEEYPDFTFSQSQASVYAIIEKYNPEMLERIKARVKEGRWEITASHWVEGDKNMAGGEALTRHILYTRRYMKELFGLEPEDVPVDWSPDTFGHSANIPVYLSKGAVKYYYLHRPGNFNGIVPEAFWWKGPDGSRVLVKNDMLYGYNGAASPKIAGALIKFVKLTGGLNGLFVYGVGDHGGGPTRRDLERIIDMDSWPVFPRVKFSGARAFFEALEKESSRLPEIKGELNAEFTGCYTSQSLIKRANRLSESRLVCAEAAAVAAWRLRCMDYPLERFGKSWRDCLFSHFHDILPGSGVRDTVHYTMGLFQNIMAESSMTETLSLRRIAAASKPEKQGVSKKAAPSSFYSDALGAGVGIGASEGNLSSYEALGSSGERVFMLFNPTAADRDEIIETTVWDNPAPGVSESLKDKKFSVTAPDGQKLPAQILEVSGTWGHQFVKIAFPAQTGGFGWAFYKVTEEETEGRGSKLKLLRPKHVCGYASHERTARFGFENDLVILEINPRTGGILRLRDKKSGVDVISPEKQTSPLEFTVERPHGMSSWCVDFPGPAEAPVIKSISTVREGPYKAEVKVEAEIRRSKFTVTYGVTEDSPLVTITVRGAWLETGDEKSGCPALRMPFPVGLDDPETSYEIPFGSISRPHKNDEEVPALGWAKVTGSKNRKKAGLLLLNDCKHGHAFDNGTLRLSLIRGSYSPDPSPELGEHEINLALLPFAGDLTSAEAAARARAFESGVRIVTAVPGPGSLPPSGRLAVVAGPVTVTCLKKAEDGGALVMRFCEMNGKDTKFSVSFDKKLAGAVRGARAVDLMEREIKGVPLTVSANRVEAEIPAFSLLSLKINF
jgi:alpha-mannosidase